VNAGLTRTGEAAAHALLPAEAVLADTAKALETELAGSRSTGYVPVILVTDTHHGMSKYGHPMET
jgi:hypothetical protein